MREAIRRLLARAARTYYWEDYMRVYPDDLVYDPSGRKTTASPNEKNNFLNHRKVYLFAAQFVRGKKVADIGCGSGYGCDILHKAGAAAVHGSDISKHAIRFARSRFGASCRFSLQEMTNLKAFGDHFFDVTLSSEVLEHIKEFRREAVAIREMKRITKEKGLILLATPNSEVTGGHGFDYDEFTRLLNDHFADYCLFENALLPFGPDVTAWEQRLAAGKVGVIVSQNIRLEETMRISKERHVIKKGIPPGSYDFRGLSVQTGLLHNTHSWIVLAINPGAP